VALGVEIVGDMFDMPEALTFTPTMASSLLSAIIGAMIGLVGFVVTVTVLRVQTATGQLTARSMRLLHRDRLLKAVLGVLLGTFAYSFVLLRRVGESEAPDLGLVILGGLLSSGVVLFLVFLLRILQRRRPVAVASSVADLGTRAFPALVQPRGAGAAPAPVDAEGVRVPAVNDPTTATQVLDHVEDLLLVVGRNDFSGRGVHHDAGGAPRS
jgi:uncharacterized membrane protein